MPKKTKKEKIIAEYRKRLETVQANGKWEMRTEKLDTEMGNQKLEISPQNISLPNPASHVSLPILSSLYIMKDLRKTFLLAFLAISIEFSIYFLTKGGV